MSEIVISSVVVYCQAEEQESIETRLRILESVSFFPEFSGDGKIVVVLEAPSTQQTEKILNDIEKVHGVLSVRLVYNHVESEKAMSEEIS